MGNGFCFPLETLIFASLAYAVGVETGDRDFSVYGDDIIVRQRSALYLIEILNYCGFRVNKDKTFVFGPFKESCGADWFNGVDVRAYYIDEIPRKQWDLFKWLNGIRRRYGRCASWDFLLGHVEDSWRLLRPFEGPDDAITASLDEFMGSPYAQWDRNQHRWKHLRVVHRPVIDIRVFSPSIDMYALLRGTVSSENGHPQLAFRRKTRTHVSRQ
jgi:hypothetical protein